MSSILGSPSVSDYGDGRSDSEDDFYNLDDEDARMWKTVKYYRRDIENGREQIEGYLKKKLGFIPNLKLSTWAEYARKELNDY